MRIFFPLEILADFITYNLFPGEAGIYWTDALNFFILATLKISILMFIISWLMAMLNYYLPMEKIKHILTKRRWYGLDHLVAAFLGVITPFCSCSSIPLFVGFVGAGIPLGVTLSFLISSPLVNEASLIIFPALFGWELTIAYNVIGVIIAIMAGTIIGKLGMEKYIAIKIKPNKTEPNIIEEATKKLTKKQLCQQWGQSAWNLTTSTMPYIIIGVGIGALIKGFVPAFIVEKVLAGNNWWSVPLATILGVPLYANGVGVIPIVEALIAKGANVGTTFAFMTATVTLSIPQLLLLKKVMKWPLLLTYYGIVTIGMIIMGYILNFIF